MAMGLAIVVGLLPELVEMEELEAVDWFRECFQAVNRVLLAAHLPPHAEPEEISVPASRCSIGSYPYSFLHYLRRIYAHFEADPEWRPTPDMPHDPAQDPVLSRSNSTSKSHLIRHSDSEGFYLPIDFKDVLFSNDKKVLGGKLGSSYRLMEELVAVAPLIGVTLNNGQLSDEEAARVDALGGADGFLSTENIVWLSLYEAARLSIEHKAAICFT
jgi:hypothetical protein